MLLDVVVVLLDIVAMLLDVVVFVLMLPAGVLVVLPNVLVVLLNMLVVLTNMFARIMVTMVANVLEDVNGTRHCIVLFYCNTKAFTFSLPP